MRWTLALSIRNIFHSGSTTAESSALGGLASVGAGAKEKEGGPKSGEVPKPIVDLLLEIRFDLLWIFLDRFI